MGSEGEALNETVSVRTVRERVAAYGMNLDRFEEMLAAGRVWLNGEPVQDGETEAPEGSSIVYSGG